MNDRLPIRDRTLILRILVPGLEARLRDKMKETEDEYIAQQLQQNTNAGGGNNNSNNRSPGNKSNDGSGLNKERILDMEGVTCEPTMARNRTLWNFHCDGATYPAKLVNLPCPVELHKTHDHAAYYKSVDIAQMLIVYEDDIALTEADEKPTEGYPSYYHSGLTPPMKRVVERRFTAREHSAQPPPRAAVTDVETELLSLMDKLAKDEKTKRNKVPTLTSANKVLEDIVEDVVEYEPWMDDNGRQLGGVEFDTDDQLCKAHPEVWLSPDTIRQLKDEELEEHRRKQAIADKKEAKRREKKEIPSSQPQHSATATTSPSVPPPPTKKKGIASKKNTPKVEPVDEVTQAAMLIGDSEDLDFMNDDMFDGIELDLDNFDAFDL